jgi:hypothetical protein
MELGGTIILHYYLANESHAMNASVRNKCESEALALFTEVARLLNVQMRIESVAHKEGGLLETWQFLAENKDELTVISSVVMPLVVVALTKAPKSNPGLDALSIEEKRLSNEEKKLTIEKLRRELLENKVRRDTCEGVSAIIEGDQKVAFRKSNFYRLLNGYKKVTGVGVTPTDNKFKSTEPEQFIGRQDFHRFVLKTDKLPFQVIEDAKIEIISPVLREGDYQWKGMFEGVIIPFSMADADFKKSVLREQVSFRHGSIIECVLKIERKFNEVGEITPTHYAVTTVLNKSDGAVTVETAQGKRFLVRKKLRDDQLDLCFHCAIADPSGEPEKERADGRGKLIPEG